MEHERTHYGCEECDGEGCKRCVIYTPEEMEARNEAVMAGYCPECGEKLPAECLEYNRPHDCG